MRKNLYYLVLLCSWLMSQAAEATTYYVSASSGQNNRTKVLARNMATPWLRIQQALDSAAAGDTVWVMPGTYVESDTIKRPVTLLGNGGSGTKPVIAPPLSPLSQTCINVRAQNTTIQNFELRFNQIFCIYGIYAAGNNLWTGLRIFNNRILSVGTGAPCIIFNSYGVYATGNNDTITIRGNFIGTPDPNVNCFPGRAVWLTNLRATIGGPAVADSNFLVGAYAIQSATVRGNWRVTNNRLFGIGFLLNTTATSGSTQFVENNTFSGIQGAPLFALLEIRSCSLRNGRVIVRGNKFLDYGGAGVFSGRSRNVFIDSNEFTPGSPDAVGVHLNTKFQTAGTNFPGYRNSAFITGNRFNPSMTGDSGGTAIFIADHNNSARDTSWFDFNFGGTGRNANWFSRKLSRVLTLDTNTRQSVAFPAWGTYPITNMAPVRANVNLANNLFEMPDGSAKTPADMTLDERFLLADRTFHRLNDPRIGVVSIVPNHAFVTRKSFSEPRNFAPSINRGLSAVMDGGAVFVQPDTLDESVRTTVNATVNGRPGRTLVWRGIRMSAPGKTLTLGNNTVLNDTLWLGGGLLNVGNSNVLLRSGIGLYGGSATSYMTFGSGKFQQVGVSTDSLVAHVGTAASYAPATIKPSVTLVADTLTLALRTAPTAANYSPALPAAIASHAGLQWTVSRNGNNTIPAARVSFAWPSTTEENGPLDNRPRIQAFDGTGWKRYNSTYATQTSTTTGVTALGEFAVTNDLRPFVLATSVAERFLCSGRDSITVRALTADTFRAGNTFTFELSNAAGNFANPITLISVADTLAVERKVQLPSGLPFGTGYRIRVLASDPALLGDSTLTTISLDSVPGAPTITPLGATTFCVGDSVRLDGPAGFVGYRWSTGETTRSIVVGAAGNYTLSVINAGLCQSPMSAPVAVTLTTIPAAPTVTLTAGNPAFCAGDSATLSAPAGFASYLWNNGATTRNITVRVSGRYNVRVGNSNSCLSDTANSPVNITVLPRPARPVISRQGNDTLLAPAGATRYEWFRNGVRVTGTTSTLIVTTSGSYTVVAFQGLCASDTSAPTSVVISSARSIPASFVKLYPNPASEVLNVELDGLLSSTASAALLDAMGRQLQTITMGRDGHLLKGNISLDGLPAGIYTVVLRAEGRMVSRQVVKQ